MILSRVLGDGANEHINLRALILVDELCALSFFPILKACLRMRPATIFYNHASKLGLKLAFCLKGLGLVSGEPKQIKDVFLCDTPHGVGSQIRLEAFEAGIKIESRINKVVDKVFPEMDSDCRRICVLGIRKEWQRCLEELFFLQNIGRVLSKEEKISSDKIILVSSFASLLKQINFDSKFSGGIKIVPPTIHIKTWLYLWGTVFFSLGQTLMSFVRPLNAKKNCSTNEEKGNRRIGVAAAWGFEGTGKNRVDDLYWWRESTIPAESLVYMFERHDIQPTEERLSDLKKLGITPAVLNKKYTGSASGSMIMNHELNFKEGVQSFLLHSKLAMRSSLEDMFNRSVISLVGWQIFKSAELMGIYKTVKLRGLFHFQEGGFESINLAARRSNVVRIGGQWSCLTAPSNSTSRSKEVSFVWGPHDLKIILDSVTMSKHILISGCFMDELSHKEEHQKGWEAVQSMKKRGVRYILAVFDNSLPVPNFYQFFLQWLIDDPNLGILIKSKKKSGGWINEVENKELVDQALASERLFEMDQGASPIDAALLSDFSIGVTGISAIILAALKGARVLYLDYERLDQGPVKKYTILHSLGPRRCVFYDTESLKESILEYVDSPEKNPLLGDVSIVLEKVDPFRDGKASQRIGEYVAWFLEGVDQKMSNDEALKFATKKYAEKWGEDKVIRPNI